MPETEDSRAELLMTAAEGALDADGRRRLDALRLDEPGIDHEIAELRGILEGVAGLGAWDGAKPSAGLRERIAQSAAPAASPSAEVPSAAPASEPAGVVSVVAPAEAPRAPRVDVLPTGGRRRLPILLAAAACLVIGVAGGVAIGSSIVRTEPGTLGALEHIEFVADSDRTRVDGDLVAHSWGTETLFEADGLEAGAAYSVVLIEEDGDIIDSGSFIGTDGTVTCRMNAGVLRDEVVEVRILQASHIVASAVVPPVD